MSRLLVPIVLLVSALGLVFSYIRPTYEDLKQHQALKERLENAGTTIREFDTKKNILTAQYSTMSENDLKRLKRMLPDIIDPVRVIIDIDNAARIYDLNVDAFTLPASMTEAVGDMYVTAEGEPAPLLGYTSEQFMVTLKGDYPSFKSFLTMIESNLALMDVSGFGLDASGGPEETVPGEYLYQVALKVHHLQ